MNIIVDLANKSDKYMHTLMSTLGLTLGLLIYGNPYINKPSVYNL